MAVKDSIFGSRREERFFRSIEHTWGKDYCQWREEVGPLGRSKTVPLGVNGQQKCPH